MACGWFFISNIVDSLYVLHNLLKFLPIIDLGLDKYYHKLLILNIISA